MRWRIALALVVGPFVTGRGLAQDSLADAVERVRQGWLVHDVQAVVGQSASVVLQIPGADPSAAVERAQAIELLRRHLRAGVERALSVKAVRELEPGRGYAELDRRYVVAGTSDERRETIFLGFRKPGPKWLLAEVRSAP